MSEDSKTYCRWYDQDQIVSKCVKMLETLPDSLKRQTATFIVDKIICQSPYQNMMSDEVFHLATEDDRKRRWYDFDEIVRIFIELLRHSSDETKKKIAIVTITFVEDMTLDRSNSIEIVESEEENEFWFMSKEN